MVCFWPVGLYQDPSPIGLMVLLNIPALLGLVVVAGVRISSAVKAPGAGAAPQIKQYAVASEFFARRRLERWCSRKSRFDTGCWRHEVTAHIVRGRKKYLSTDFPGTSSIPQILQPGARLVGSMCGANMASPVTDR
jgi:hypothetical protein